MARVLLVEDDAHLREGLTLALRRQRHEIEQAATGEDGVQRARSTTLEIVVLDLMLPGIDGFEVCRRIRQFSSIPIVMLSASGDDFDVVAGLEAGADDYVVKPVEPRVLDARIRALLRRLEAAPSSQEIHDELAIDRSALTVSKRGHGVELAPTELRLLLTLAQTPARVFSRSQLLELVWEQDYLGDSRLVDACVQRLRAKVEDEPANPRYVQTVRGFGYRFGPV
jgi:two-component system, OmpR family, response regulator MtrA